MVGIGAIAGAQALGRFGQGRSQVNMILFGLFGLGAGVFLLAVFGHWLAALVLTLGFGGGATCVLVSSQTLLQQETRPEMMGRVSSTSASIMTATQLAAFGGAGSIAGWIGIRNLFLAGGALLMLIALAGCGYWRLNQRSRPDSACGQDGVHDASRVMKRPLPCDPLSALLEWPS